MKLFASIILTTLFFQTMILFDFNTETSLKNWNVVDDGVMGGRSQGQFFVNDSGHGNFKGDVSLENNGGFSSVRYSMDSKDVSSYSKFVIRLKGDGKNYQFRSKSNNKDRHSYISEFQTSGDWQTIEIDFETMYPAYRGRKLRIPNYAGEILEEIAFLIGNKKEQTFNLEIDSISLQ